MMGKLPSVLNCLLAAVILASSNFLSSHAQEDPRVKELLRLQTRSVDRVIRLDENLFRRYGQGDEPRSYSLLIFFDAKDLRQQNPELKLPEFRREFTLVAETYVKTHAGGPEEGKVFFCDVEFRQSQNIFRAFRVESLPHIRLVPAGDGKSFEMRADQFARSAEGVAQFLTAKTSIPVGHIVRPPPVTKTQMAVLGAFIIGAAPFVIKYALNHKTPLHDMRLWCLGGLAIYFFAVSGGMYNIIRGMPMYVPDREKPNKFQYWYGSSGAQFGVEGFSIGGLYTLVGLLLATATHLAPRIPSRPLQRGVILICLIAGYSAVRQLVALDQWKTGYRIHAFYPRSWR